jgi:DnaJ-class molecular chaperone
MNPQITRDALRAHVELTRAMGYVPDPTCRKCAGVGEQGWGANRRRCEACGGTGRVK